MRKEPTETVTTAALKVMQMCTHRKVHRTGVLYWFLIGVKETQPLPFPDDNAQ